MTETAFLQELFPGEHFIAQSHFSLLHDIVLGFSSLDLGHVLESSPKIAINSVDSEGRTALWWAARRGDHSAVASLLRHGADPTKSTANRSSPFTVAVWSENQACIRLLLSDCDIQETNSHKWTSLHYSCYRRCDTDIVESLLRKGADINMPDQSGVTPLMLAVQENRANICELLISYGANLKMTDYDGENYLSIALYNSHNEMTRLLLDHQADHRFRTKTGETILHHAAQYGDLECLRILYSFELHGINVEDKVIGISPQQALEGLKGLTALQIAEKRPDMGAEWLDMFRKLHHRMGQPESKPSVDTDLDELEDFQDALEHQDNSSSSVSPAIGPDSSWTGSQTTSPTSLRRRRSC